jgi:hypothetical protein
MGYPDYRGFYLKSDRYANTNFTDRILPIRIFVSDRNANINLTDRI